MHLSRCPDVLMQNLEEKKNKHPELSSNPIIACLDFNIITADVVTSIKGLTALVVIFFKSLVPGALSADSDQDNVVSSF